MRIGTQHEKAAGCIVGNGVFNADIPVLDSAIDNLYGRPGVVDSRHDIGNHMRITAQVAPRTRLSPLLWVGLAARNGFPRIDQGHVGEITCHSLVG